MNSRAHNTTITILLESLSELLCILRINRSISSASVEANKVIVLGVNGP